MRCVPCEGRRAPCEQEEGEEESEEKGLRESEDKGHLSLFYYLHVKCLTII
jgi:hypothetical protein